MNSKTNRYESKHRNNYAENEANKVVTASLNSIVAGKCKSSADA